MFKKLCKKKILHVIYNMLCITYYINFNNFSIINTQYVQIRTDDI